MLIIEILSRVPRQGQRAVGCLLAAGLLCAGTAARAEYHLAVGDTLQITVARAPELQQRVPVDSDGSISFPLLGTLVVTGLTPAQAQAKIKAGLANKPLQRTRPDGRSEVVVIDPGEVTATIAEYRPIYVNGDVSKPGEYPFRPLMTVRQAVALSGGYDTFRFRMTDPNIDIADLRSQYEALWIEFAKERAHIWRLKAELGGDAKGLDLSDVPLPPSLLAEIVSLATADLNARRSDNQRQKEFLQRAIKQDADEIETLSQQQQSEEQGAEADAEELKKDLELLSKGTLISPRVTDARRAVLLSSSRKLQTVVELMQLKKQQDEVHTKLDQFDDQRRIQLLGELQDANANLGELRAKLQGAEEKIRVTDLLRSQLAQGNGSGPEIAIIRRSETGSLRLVVSEEAELEPGDVVEVSLHRTIATQ
jgi:polysaccharide biosynthesis/export protein